MCNVQMLDADKVLWSCLQCSRLFSQIWTLPGHRHLAVVTLSAPAIAIDVLVSLDISMNAPTLGLTDGGIARRYLRFLFG